MVLCMIYNKYLPDFTSDLFLLLDLTAALDSVLLLCFACDFLVNVNLLLFFLLSS